MRALFASALVADRGRLSLGGAQGLVEHTGSFGRGPFVEHPATVGLVLEAVDGPEVGHGAGACGVIGPFAVGRARIVPSAAIRLSQKSR